MTPKNPNSGKKPKSFKKDGSPKVRWSSEKRSALGHGPRHRGGVGRDQDGRRGSYDARQDHQRHQDADRREGERRFDDHRGGRNFDDRRGGRNFDDRRGGRNFDDRRGGRNFDDRRGGRDGDDRRGGRDFGERRGGWNSRDDRGFDNRRDDRGFDNRRDDRRGGWQREDRFERRDRDDRRDDRGHRPNRFERDDRPNRFERDDRPNRFERDDRPRRDDRALDDRFREDRPRHERPNHDPRAMRGGQDRTRFERNQHRHDDRFERPSRLEREAASYDSDDQDVMSWEQGQDAEVLDVAGVDTTAGFSELGVPAELVAVLNARQITTPFPIQQATIPVAMAGRDVLGRGRTGSGKTLAFSLPLVARLAEQGPNPSRKPRAMILVPTRELALQCADVIAPLAAAAGQQVVLVAGGMSYGPQLKAFDKGVDIVVATPGRLIDLLEQGAADLSEVTITVLDEADHMAELGFMEAVTTLLDAVAEGGQKMLFSATLDGAVDRLVKKYLKDPSLHEVDSGQASVSTMEHVSLLVPPHEKVAMTSLIANRPGRTVLFARTQRGASRIAEQLRENGVMAGALHGGLTQGARARVLGAFKSGSVPVLVATDVAARGIHIDDVSLVLQVDPPMNSKDYLHRAGRTARAGEDGMVVSIILPHQRRSTLRLLGQAGVKAEPVKVNVGDGHVEEVTGGSNPTGDPISEDQFNELIAPPKRPSRGGAPRHGGQGRGGYGRGRDRGGRGGGRGDWNRGDRGGHGGSRDWNKGGRSDKRWGKGGGSGPIAESGGWDR